MRGLVALALGSRVLVLVLECMSEIGLLSIRVINSCERCWEGEMFENLCGD